MNIMIAEDSPVTLRLMKAMLEKLGYDVTAVGDGAAAWEQLQRPGGPPMAILDWIMPGMTGLEVCRAVRRTAGLPYTYLILLTANSRQEDLVEGMAAGADDYLIKPPDPNELDVRLRAGRRILELQTTLLTAQMDLKALADRDPLTGLLNRRSFEEQYMRECSRQNRGGRPMGLILADLDRFKAVNDTHGHAAGDAVLREFGSRFAALSRGHDAVARWGGEEFTALLADCNPVQALRFAERLRRSIRGKAFVIPGGAIPVTISVGVTLVAPGAMGELSSAMDAADRALYRAKALGRDRVEFQAMAAPRAREMTA